jgi:hypothetical protein
MIRKGGEEIQTACPALGNRQVADAPYVASKTAAGWRECSIERVTGLSSSAARREECLVTVRG